jgi:hypothetical protein
MGLNFFLLKVFSRTSKEGFGFLKNILRLSTKGNVPFLKHTQDFHVLGFRYF